ncbi:MAG: DUF6788 family protein [Victivallales bacterium]
MKKLRMLVRAIVGVGPILPGSVSRQFNVCGMPGCRCKDKKEPRKHGPYFQLSYGAKGRSSSMLVKEADAGMVGMMTGNYRRIRDLTVETGFEMVALCREKGVDEAARIYSDILEREKSRSIGRKSEPQAQKESGDERERKLARSSMIEKKRVEARDLRASRAKWRKEALSLREKLAALEGRLKSAGNEKFLLEGELKKERR